MAGQLRHMLRDDDINHAEQKQILELGMKFRENRFYRQPFAGPDDFEVGVGYLVTFLPALGEAGRMEISGPIGTGVYACRDFQSAGTGFADTFQCLGHVEGAACRVEVVDM